ncbi:MAG: tetratricopeptide repeat protein [Bacteroidaceae bacterium]|nr:tetratricopeptide repeat protein [Bacteroidaceae bacterium]
MIENKEDLDKMIMQAIRRVGQERDAEDIATLKRFMDKRQQKSKVRKLVMSITSIAAIIAIVFSFNIYQDNRRMDKLFETYYTPLEYDSQLMSRGEETISSDLTYAMEAYQNKDYVTALQKFNTISQVDENYLIYKAICLLEADKTKDAIALLEELVGNGEGTEYYQQACWYLALAYLNNHEDDKALELLNPFYEKNENIKSLINSLN